MAKTKSKTTKGEAADATKCGASGEKKSSTAAASSSMMSDDERIEFHASIYSYFRRLLLREREAERTRLEKIATATETEEGTVPEAPDDDGGRGGAGGSDEGDGDGDRSSLLTEQPTASGGAAVDSIGVPPDGGAAASADGLDDDAAAIPAAAVVGVASDDADDSDAVAKIGAVLEALSEAFPESAEGEGDATAVQSEEVGVATDLEARYRRGAEQSEQETKKSPGRKKKGAVKSDSTRRRSSRGASDDPKQDEGKKARGKKKKKKVMDEEEGTKPSTPTTGEKAKRKRGRPKKRKADEIKSEEGKDETEDDEASDVVKNEKEAKDEDDDDADETKSPPTKRKRYNKIDPILKEKMSAIRAEARKQRKRDKGKIDRMAAQLEKLRAKAEEADRLRLLHAGVSPLEVKRRINAAARAAEAQHRGEATYTWEERYEQLKHYRAGYGNCLIPRRYPTNQGLSNWVQKQRLLYKEMHVAVSLSSSFSGGGEGLNPDGPIATAGGGEGMSPERPEAATTWKATKARSILTDERIDKLNAVGFVWRAQSHEVKSWDERFLDLVAFKNKHGHCNVPKNFRDDPSLAEFCKTQRRLYKAKDDKYKPGTERVTQLEEIGFKFTLAPPIKRWEERFLQLVEFRRIHGHCRVPQPKAGKPAEVDVDVPTPAPVAPVDAVSGGAAPVPPPDVSPTAAIVGPNGLGGEIPAAVAPVVPPQPNFGDGFGTTASMMPPPQTIPVNPTGRPPSSVATTTPAPAVDAAVATASTADDRANNDDTTMVGDNPDDERAFRRWANRQKSEYWKYRNDRTSSLDKARVKKLEALGFDFGSTPLLHVAEAFAVNPALL